MLIYSSNSGPKTLPSLLPSLNTIENMPPGGLIAGWVPHVLKNRGTEVVQEQKGVLMESVKITSTWGSVSK